VSTQVAIVLTAVRFRHQHLHIAPNHFFRTIAKNARRCWIEVLHDSLCVDGYYRFLDRVNDGAPPRRVPAPLCDQRDKEERTERDAKDSHLGSPNVGLRCGTNFAEMPEVEGDCTNDCDRKHEYCCEREGRPGTCRKPQY